MHDDNPRRALRAAVALLLGVLLIAPAGAASLDEIRQRGTVRVAVANEIPYGFLDFSGNAKGVGPEVAAAVLKRMGLERIDWIATGFSSLIPGLKADRFDLVAAEMAILPQRCREVDFSSPNSSYGEGLLVAAGNPKGIRGYADFAEREDLTVAIMAGADQLEMLQALGVPQQRMVMIDANADAIAAVSSGRADAYAATGLTVADLADKGRGVEAVQDFEDPVIDGEPVRSWGAFAFNADADDFRAAFDAALAEFKQTDEWRVILERYGFSNADLDASFARSTEELCAAD